MTPASRQEQWRVTFDAAHRIPDHPHCRHLHGHAFTAWITLTRHPNPDTSADAVCLDQGRHALQQWINTHFHGGAILGHQDPLIDCLAHNELHHYAIGADEHSHHLDWPTLDTLATILTRAATTYTTRAALPATITNVTVHHDPRTEGTGTP